MSRLVLAAPPRRVLAVQLRRIGDAVLLTPVLDAMAAAWPDARVHLLTEPPVPDLFRADPRVAAVWIRHRDRRLALARALRAERFDLVLDFQSLPWTALLTRFLGRPSVGFRRRYRGWCYRAAVRLGDHAGTDYAADHKLDLLRAAGLRPVLSPPRLVPPPAIHAAWAAAGDRPRVVLVPVSRRVHKRWPVERFAETARLIAAATGAFTVVAAGPGEDATAAEAAALLGAAPHAVAVASTLGELASLLAGAHLFVGNDNGPRHIAIALGVPTVAFFGPQNPTHWTPPGDHRHVVLWDRGRAGDRPVREDLPIVPPLPEAAAEAAAALLAAGGGPFRPDGPSGGGTIPSAAPDGPAAAR